MARSYATIDVGIWDDDFNKLSAGAQRTYFLLVTQADINACGSLSLTLRRWAKTCPEKDLEVWLAELSDHNYVLIDEDTEELLVRTFAKWDGGYKHPKRRASVVATANAIRSPFLKAAVWDELAKLSVTKPSRIPSGTDSGGAVEAPESPRSVVALVGKGPTPETINQEPEPAPSETDVEPSPFCPKHPNGTDKPCIGCGNARMRLAGWVKSFERRDKAAKAERIALAKNCSDCHGTSQLEDAAGNYLGKCDHLAPVAARGATS